MSEDILNISLIANKLLDLETTPPADDAEDDTKKYYQYDLRKTVLDLHHELEDEFRARKVSAELPYMEALYELCRMENTPAETEKWKVERDKYAAALLIHLRQHEIVKLKQETGEWPPSHQPEDLKKFVTEWVAGRVFTSLHVRTPDDVTRVFMALGLGGLPDRAMYELQNAALVYEFLDKAGPLAVNGMPTFFSCRFMNHADWERCRKAIKKLEEAQKELEV